MINVRTSILILGIGNILLRDEGVGVRVAEQLQKIPLPENVEALDGGTSGADLLDIIAGLDKLIVVDAAESDRQPGTILKFTADDLAPPNQANISLHQFGLAETLHAAKLIGCQPKQTIIFGVVPADVTPGLELTEKIKLAAEDAVDLILKEIGA
jgi:hydrogenase maturation protease